MNRHQRRINSKLRRAPNSPRAENATGGIFPGTAELLQVGLKHHRAGQLAQAEACYQKVLAGQPDNADALHLLGVIAYQAGRHGSAVELIRKAIQRNGKDAAYLSNLGLVLRKLGQLDEAIASYHQAISIRPSYLEAYCNLAAALFDQGKFDEAISAYRQAIRIKPDHAEAHFNLGLVLKEQSKFDDAIAAYRRAIEIKPDFAAAYSNLGVELNQQGQLDAAIAAYRQAIRINPDHAEAFANLGAALNDQGKLDEAIVACRQAIRIKPNYAQAHSNLGAALCDQGKLDEAIKACRQAIVLKPDLAGAHNNLGFALMQLGKISEAHAAFELAVKLAPRAARYRYNLGDIIRFSAGDPHLAAMEQLTRHSASLPVGDRVALHFALAKAYEDVGLNTKAFQQWLEGNALKRRQIAYDEAATLGELDRVRATFTAELIRARQDVGSPSSVPIFIVGMPRAGSTLVEQILASHPQVFGGGELTHFRKAIEGIRIPPGDSATFPELVSSMARKDFHELGARYLAETERLAPGATHITDKLPSNFIFAGFIHLALPNAPIIHTIRDPVDTCISCFSKLFAEKQNHTYDLAELGRYYRHYQALMAHWQCVLPPGRILDVRYEDVVADLEGQARRIVAYCGLDWDARCLAFHRTQRPVRTASATQVRLPLYNSSVGRRRMYEEFLDPLLAELGTAGGSGRTAQGHVGWRER